MLGSPIAHSLSPVLHRAAYAHLGLERWRYDAIEVADLAGLREVLEGQWAGLSLTMPLKRLVTPLLDQVSDLARDVGAVNTVTFGPRGRVGDNTDVQGIVAALAEGGVTTLSPGAGCILGGGATAAAALAALSVLGDRAPMVVARDPARAAQALAAAERLGSTPRLVLWPDAGPVVRAASVVVSTVPASAGLPWLGWRRRSRPASCSTSGTTHGPLLRRLPGKAPAVRRSAGLPCSCTKRWPRCG